MARKYYNENKEEKKAKMRQKYAEDAVAGPRGFFNKKEYRSRSPPRNPGASRFVNKIVQKKYQNQSK